MSCLCIRVKDFTSIYEKMIPHNHSPTLFSILHQGMLVIEYFDKISADWTESRENWIHVFPKISTSKNGCACSVTVIGKKIILVSGDQI